MKPGGGATLLLALLAIDSRMLLPSGATSFSSVVRHVNEDTDGKALTYFKESPALGDLSSPRTGGKDDEDDEESGLFRPLIKAMMNMFKKTEERVAMLFVEMPEEAAAANSSSAPATVKDRRESYDGRAIDLLQSGMRLRQFKKYALSHEDFDDREQQRDLEKTDAVRSRLQRSAETRSGSRREKRGGDRDRNETRRPGGKNKKRSKLPGKKKRKRDDGGHRRRTRRRNKTRRKRGKTSYDTSLMSEKKIDDFKRQEKSFETLFSNVTSDLGREKMSHLMENKEFDFGSLTGDKFWKEYPKYFELDKMNRMDDLAREQNKTFRMYEELNNGEKREAMEEYRKYEPLTRILRRKRWSFLGMTEDGSVRRVQKRKTKGIKFPGYHKADDLLGDVLGGFAGRIVKKKRNTERRKSFPIALWVVFRDAGANGENVTVVRKEDGLVTVVEVMEVRGKNGEEYFVRSNVLRGAEIPPSAELGKRSPGLVRVEDGAKKISSSARKISSSARKISNSARKIINSARKIRNGARKARNGARKIGEYPRKVKHHARKYKADAAEIVPAPPEMMA